MQIKLPSILEEDSQNYGVKTWVDNNLQIMAGANKGLVGDGSSEKLQAEFGHGGTERNSLRTRSVGLFYANPRDFV